MIKKVDSVKVSERVLDLVSDTIDALNEEGTNIGGYLSTFNNCREQGFYLTAYNKYDYNRGDFFAWVAQARNSDAIMVVISTEPDRPTIKGMFSENAYNNAKYFNYNEEHKAASCIIEQIINFFSLKNTMED